MSFLVAGAGAWGTAIAVHLSRKHASVFLWARNAEHIAAMSHARENKCYLPGIIFPAYLKLTTQFVDAEYMIIAVPSHAFRETLEKLKPYIKANQKLVCITKGLDLDRHQFLEQTAKEILGENITYAVLSGPTFAAEVARELPTAVTLASRHKNLEENLVNIFHSPHFRVYFSEDTVGVQLGGAVKNVLAVAVGIAEGMRCGANAQAALITRGLSEMRRLGAALQAQPETLMGLSGVGDLILTCTSNQSRNRRFGIALGQGITRESAQHAIGQVVEGIYTTREIYALAQQHSVEMPITKQVYQILYENLSVQQGMKNLLMREPKSE